VFQKRADLKIAQRAQREGRTWNALNPRGKEELGARYEWGYFCFAACLEAEGEEENTAKTKKASMDTSTEPKTRNRRLVSEEVGM